MCLFSICYAYTCLEWNYSVFAIKLFVIINPSDKRKNAISSTEKQKNTKHNIETTQREDLFFSFFKMNWKKAMVFVNWVNLIVAVVLRSLHRFCALRVFILLFFFVFLDTSKLFVDRFMDVIAFARYLPSLFRSTRSEVCEIVVNFALYSKFFFFYLLDRRADLPLIASVTLICSDFRFAVRFFPLIFLSSFFPWHICAPHIFHRATFYIVIHTTIQAQTMLASKHRECTRKRSLFRFSVVVAAFFRSFFGLIFI